MKKSATIIIGTVLALAIIVFFVVKYTKDSKTPEKITIGYSQLRISLPVFVAQEQGYFKKYGLDVELKGYPTAQPMMEALVSGNIDIAGYCALPITFSAMNKTKKELIFITSIMEDDQHQISKLIAKNDAGINSIQDLKGKRIGILPTRAYEVWLKLILAKNGLDADRDNIIIQQVAPDMQKDALSSGNIQALFSNDPVATIVLTNNIGKDLSPNIDLVSQYTGLNPLYFGSFNISKKYADANPETVESISLALDDAISFITNNPKEAYLLMNKYFDPKFAPLADKYPTPLFYQTNKILNSDLQKSADYYFENKVITDKILQNNGQYSRK